MYSEANRIHSESFYFSSPYPVSISASKFFLIRSSRGVFGTFAESGKIFIGKQLTPLLQEVAISPKPKTTESRVLSLTNIPRLTGGRTSDKGKGVSKRLL